MKQQQLMTVYQRLLEAYGAQNWWPADSTFEVMIGAVLTQNTAWANVEKAISNLKRSNNLVLESILALSDEDLVQLIRPSGYFNIKAKRLKNLCLWKGVVILDEYDYPREPSSDLVQISGTAGRHVV
ncbi:MAG: hypothetical protein ACE1ZM_04750, partial [Gammaproteobacteria bacterium]